MLKLSNVSVRYGAIQALRNVSINVRRGGITGIIGSNGAGKSTCLKAISGLVNVDEGDVVFDGQVINKVPVEKRVPLGIAHVMEGRRLFTNQSVEDNLLLGAYLRLKRERRSEVQVDIDAIYERFPILHQRRKQLAVTLSGGEQQMLVIGKALVSRPRLLLLDEPSLGLAPIIVEDMFEHIKELRQSGLTIVLVEQLATATLAISDYVYVLERGAVRAEGAPEELLKEGVESLLGAYLGNAK